MIYFLVFIAAAARFLPHPPNVACIGALGLLAGCYVQGRRAYLLPMIALGLSDLVGAALRIPGMGFYSPITMAAVYAGMFASVPIGRWVSRLDGKCSKWISVPSASVAASTVFFLISNAGVAFFSGWYPVTAGGILSCYIAAIPFYGFTLAGDLVFTSVMFAAMHLSVTGVAPGSSRSVGSESLAV